MYAYEVMNNINRYVKNHLLAFQGLVHGTYYSETFCADVESAQFEVHLYQILGRNRMRSFYMRLDIPPYSIDGQIEKIISYVLRGFYSLFSQTNGVSNYMSDFFFPL